MSRRLIVIFVIGAIVLIWGWLDGPAARQERGMKAAHVLQLQLQPRLDADPRFSGVNLGVSTHPALFAHGTVRDEQALQNLKSIIVVPPDAGYRLIFNVNVDKGAAT